MKVRARGFTATEMLVAMVIVGILLVIGVPSFVSSLLAMRLNSQMSDLQGTLQRARSESITRATPATVCRSSNGTSCDTSAGGWEIGWALFIDGNGNGTIDASDTVIRVTPALLPGFTLRAPTAFANVVTYKSDGSAQAGGHFILCRNNALSTARAVNVNLVGRIASAGDANKNGIPESDAGADYTTCTP